MSTVKTKNTKSFHQHTATGTNAKVTLINYDEDAADQLIFTKHTRLNMTPGLLQEIRNWPWEKKEEELRYMAGTIPSSWEFTNYTFLIEGVSRNFTHQFVRSRQWSFAQQSLRVVDAKNADVVVPERLEFETKKRLPFDTAIRQSFLSYRQLIDSGIATEDARAVLPGNIATNIVGRCNMRTFVETAKSRLGGRTQGEYQAVMELMVECVLEVHPWMKHFLFGDRGRDYFREIEEFAEEQFGGDLLTKGRLLKIVDAMRKSG